MTVTLYYIHDPMCSWCWGYRPAWQRLRKELAGRVDVANVLGGLAPDTDQPMPVAMQENLKGIWRQIQKQLGTEFNFDFWSACQPKRATHKACRAVIAADGQDRQEEMVFVIQQAYYLRAMNPSETSALCQLAEELMLDVKQFASDLDSKDTHRKLTQQIGFSQKLHVDGFPSLRLAGPNGVRPIAVDYKNHRTTLAQILDAIQHPSL